MCFAGGVGGGGREKEKERENDNQHYFQLASWLQLIAGWVVTLRLDSIGLD